MPTFREIFDSVTSQQITAAEQKLKVTFPTDLWVRKDRHNTFPVVTVFTAFLNGLHDMPTEAQTVAPIPKPAKKRQTKRSN